jgi:hypothetical protein
LEFDSLLKGGLVFVSNLILIILVAENIRYDIVKTKWWPLPKWDVSPATCDFKKAVFLALSQVIEKAVHN